jgi:hypothetical protein
MLFTVVKLRLVLIEAECSDFSGFYMPRLQMSQSLSEDFLAHDLQILSSGESEDPVSDLIRCVCHSTRT